MYDAAATSTVDAYDAIARRLADAEASGRPVPPIAGDLPERTVGGAYRVLDINTRAGLAAGRRLVGRKIGLTAKSVQAQLGVDQPDYGMLFADMEVPEGDVIQAGRLIAPKVEAEMAFILAHAIENPQASSAEVLQAIDWVVPSLEIVDSRIADWKISIFDTIADNASSGRFVLGAAARRVHEIDLRLAGMVLERNGEPASFGAGAACLGSPLNSVRWLARTMAAAEFPLRAGDIVLSGALGPMVVAQAGDSFTGHIGGLGSVRVQFGRG